MTAMYQKYRQLSLMYWTLGLIVLAVQGAMAADAKSVNLVRGGDMEMVIQDGNPWAGVVNGSLRVFTGKSTIVDQTGETRKQDFPPSVAAGDLNGDGLKDLLVADSWGYYWIYLNKGTKKDFKFVRGEMFPFWIMKSKSPRIQLVDINADNILDLVIGDFEGRLFFVKNTGTAQLPKFNPSQDAKEVEVKTDSKGRLWCNYLAPYYVDWNGDGKMDLIMGEGTFSANSIFLLINQGTNSQANFDAPKLLISGEGKEHLTPRVIDWNGDGKLDIVAGERDKGTISVYLNTTENQATGPWTFSAPTPLALSSSGSIALLSAPSFEDMNGDGLPDLVIGSSSGNIRIALNSGAPKNYKFDRVDNIKGESPLPNYLSQTRWVTGEVPGGARAPESGRFHLVRAVTKNDRYKDVKNLVGYEPEFEFPADSTGKSCLLFDFTDPKHEFIPEAPHRIVRDEVHKNYVIRYPDPIMLKSDVPYELSFQVKGSGFSDTNVSLRNEDGSNVNNANVPGDENEDIRKYSFSIGSSWTKVTRKVEVHYDKEDKKKLQGWTLHFTFDGDGSFYLDDVSLVEKTSDSAPEKAPEKKPTEKTPEKKTPEKK